ncbi:MAG: hypothetical protein JWL95_1198, partial [Gemmatimonadetes bacterium]|nr:hypothetical protein [Gemmatimonadota bacterium]
MPRNILRILVRAWLLTALSDGLYASALSVFAYKSTFSRLWQGVASVLLGPTAFEGGTRTVLIGLLMHLGVALAWSTVFLLLAIAWPKLRRIVSAPAGIVGVAVVYGPIVWIVMSLAVIPLLTGRPPTITVRWWIALLGHIPFVALPIVATIGRALGATARRRAPSS